MFDQNSFSVYVMSVDYHTQAEYVCGHCVFQWRIWGTSKLLQHVVSPQKIPLGKSYSLETQNQYGFSESTLHLELSCYKLF